MAEVVAAALEEALASGPPGLVCGYLFGIVARGEVGSESDVDVAALR